jgi:menaquinol-cytochrome c reductase cytochrome b/c subunit
VVAFSIFLVVFDVFVALAPTIVVAVFMVIAAMAAPTPPDRFRRWLVAKPISFWIMTWFLCELVVLTAVGTFFRGPGWSWVWPWQGY